MIFACGEIHMLVFKRHLIGLCAALLFCTTAGAQVAVPTPGQIEDTLRKSPVLKTPETAPEIERRKSEAPATANDAIKISVSHFEFKGNSLYDSETLEGLIASYLNHPITLAQIYDAADTVTNYYTSHGYGLASVNVPAQKISGGIVKLEVIEGRVSRISVENNDRHQSDEILGYLGDVHPSQIYRGDDLQSGMRLINELPGLKAKAVVTPGDQYGTSDIVIKTREQLINGSVSLDNYGREQIDEFRLTGQVQINNPFMVEDQISLLALHSQFSHLRYYNAGYSLPINYSGTRLVMNYGRADFVVKNTPVDGYSNNTKVYVLQPLQRSNTDTADMTVGVVRNTSNTRFGGTQVGGNSITLLELSASYNHVYASQAITQVNTTLSTNFKRRNSGTTPQGVTRDDQIERLEMDVIHLQPLFERFSLLTRINGVYSPDALADSQKYNIGGPQNVRGYPASEVRGDRGYFGSAALNRPFFAGPVVFTPRLFIESGRVYSVGVPDPYDSLSSVGVGTDVNFAGGTFKIDWARPLGNHRASDGRDSGRFFGLLAYAF
jgi:hemolysin activation/secretion protein